MQCKISFEISKWKELVEMGKERQIGGEQLIQQETAMETGGKKKCKVADLELEIFHNPYLRAYTGWEQQPQPWSIATAMKYVGFFHFDCL